MDFFCPKKELQTHSEKDFELIFDDIFENRYPEEDIKTFLLKLNELNLPVNSFLGAVKALRKKMVKIPDLQECLDVCGTGGDKLNTLNISTAVAFVVAGAGIKVAKHGNRAISSKSGSADIFEELGIRLESDSEKISSSLNSFNLCFLFAPYFHPILKNLAEIRKNLAVPTIFNFLGPLLNPVSPNKQVIGTSRFDSMEKIAAVIAKSPQNEVFVVNGFDNMDEISISGKTHFLRCEKGVIGKIDEIDPRSYGFNLSSPEEIRGEDAKYNAKKLLDLLSGEKSAYRDSVLLNAGFAIYLAKKAENVKEGIFLAENSIDDGRAGIVLENLRKI